MNIFIKSWNAQSIKYNPNGEKFIERISGHLLKKEYDIVAIGLQEDCISSYLGIGYDSPLIKLLTSSIAPFYILLDEIYLSGWGVTTFKYLKKGIYQPRGLRLAIYGLYKFVQNNDIKIEKTWWVCPDVKNMITNGKGCVAMNVSVESLKGSFEFTDSLSQEKSFNITFLNMHLPFASSSLLDLSKRKNALMWQAKCLKYFYEKATIKFNPTHLFLFGDLNFRIQRSSHNQKDIIDETNSDYGPGFLITSYSSWLPTILPPEKENLSALIDLDELKVLGSYSNDENNPIPKLKEGIDDQGPLFYPTSKLDNKRFYKYGKYNQRQPSWCDRILYATFQDRNIKCISYDNWDFDSMTLSDHSAVIGVFNLN